MTAVYFMYKAAAVGLPLADSCAGPAGCKSAWVPVMTSGDVRAEGAPSCEPSQIRLCRSLLHYYIREGPREPPESFAYRPNMPVALYAFASSQ